MTPERHAEIEAYVKRLDLDQLPGWTVEQRIIADLWETVSGQARRIEAVRKLHASNNVRVLGGVCYECGGRTWPCPTIKALDGAS